jgi:hypothetical protein
MTATKTQPATNSRRTRRHVDTPTGQTEEQRLAALAAKYFATNAEANRYKGEAEKLREELLKGMEKCGMKTLSGATLPTGALLSVEVGAPAREAIDVEELRQAVTDPIFMKCVSASKKSVETHAGKHIVARCAVMQSGDTNVTVKLAK